MPDIIIKNGRQVELKNVWLLYNFERFTDFFWTRKEAWQAAYKNNFNRNDTRDIYQVLKGDIKIILKTSLKTKTLKRNNYARN